MPRWSAPGRRRPRIDCALHDLMARALGVPLYKLFGGKMRTSVPILRILAIKTPDEMAAIAGELFDEGYRYFKIKVHGDVDRGRRAREGDPQARSATTAHLTIDANQSYSPKDAIYADQPHGRVSASTLSSSRCMPRSQGSGAGHELGAGDGRGRRGRRARSTRS